jgi:hypothetical protein
MAAVEEEIWRAADSLRDLGDALDPDDRLVVVCRCLAEILTHRAGQRPVAAPVIPVRLATDTSPQDGSGRRRWAAVARRSARKAR